MSSVAGSIYLLYNGVKIKMADKNLSALEEMVYPGRVIIVGKSTNRVPIVVYGLSGRSESSQARSIKYDHEGIRVFTEPTDPKVLAKGDPALLIYNAVVSDGDVTVVSNGAQTNLIQATIDINKKWTTNMPLNLVLPVAFSGRYTSNFMTARDGRKIDLTIHEPDDPIYTPRISAIMTETYAMMSVATMDKDGRPLMTYHEFPLDSGSGKMIATYNGPNPEKPAIVPSFSGEPRDVEFGWFENMRQGAADLANRVYEAMGDFAVSAAVVLPTENIIQIKNLHENGE